MSDYTAPVLFQPLPSSDPNRQLAHVRAGLCELAERGELVMTDLFQQPAPIRDLVGMVLLSQTWADMDSDAGRASNPVPGDPVPEELAGYQVKLKFINAAEKSGKVSYPAGSRSAGNMSYRGMAKLGLNADQPLRSHEHVVKTLEAGKGGMVAVSAPEAWRALKACGKHCVRDVRRQDAKDRRELLEELRS